MTPVQKANLNIDKLNKLELDLVKFLKTYPSGFEDDRKIFEVIMLIQKERNFSIDLILKHGEYL